MTVPDEQQIRAQLGHMLGSAALRDAQRSCRLLRFLVEETLAGRASQLKEFTLGADALERGPAFDPRVDPIARVEASRLRARIAGYYAGEGAGDPVYIGLPKGSYVPRFEYRAPQEPARAADFPAAAPDPGRRMLLLGAAGGSAIALAAALGIRGFGRREIMAAAERPSIRLQARSGADGVIASGGIGVSMALSPDGRRLVFVSVRPDGSVRLFARDLTETVAHELPGTFGARHPFLSPDGRWVAFWSEGKLKKASMDGLAPVTVLADASDMHGGSWGPDGIVVTLSGRNTLARLSPDGGAPQVLFREHPPAMAMWPQSIRGGAALLFTAIDAQMRPRIDVFVPATGIRRTIVPGGTYGRYLPTSHIAYVSDGTLFVVPFDPDSLQVRGVAVALVEGVAFHPTFGYAQFDISADGTLVYRQAAAGGESTLQRLEAGTHSQPLLAPGRYLWLRVSPDGSRIAYTHQESGVFDLWVLDIATGARQRISRGEREVGSPVWTADGRHLVYGGRSGLFWASVDQTRVDQRMDLPAVLTLPGSFDPDGRLLAYYALDPKSGFDLWTVPVHSGAGGISIDEPRRFLSSSGFDVVPKFSPDGRWIAFESNVSGTSQVYVRAFPDNGYQTQVSPRGGSTPCWSRQGSHLYYTTPDRRLMQVDYLSRHGTFEVAAPRPWSDLQLADTGVQANFDVAPDGRIVALLPIDSQPGADNEFIFVTNLFQEIRRRDEAARA